MVSKIKGFKSNIRETLLEDDVAVLDHLAGHDDGIAGLAAFVKRTWLYLSMPFSVESSVYVIVGSPSIMTCEEGSSIYSLIYER